MSDVAVNAVKCELGRRRADKEVDVGGGGGRDRCVPPPDGVQARLGSDERLIDNVTRYNRNQEWPLLRL